MVRKNKNGGGLAIGCEKELKPVWLREENDEVEALYIEISLKNMKIRCVVAYGCQENDNIERKEAFWKYLDEDVQQASISGSGFILQFDGNLWAGKEIIPGDPNKQNRNGKLFHISCKFIRSGSSLNFLKFSTILSLFSLASSFDILSHTSFIFVGWL